MALVSVVLLSLFFSAANADEDTEASPSGMAEPASSSLNVREAFQRGSDLMIEDDPDGAVSYFLQVLESEPDHYGAHHNLGLIHFQDENDAEAIYHLRKASSIDPDEGYTHFLLGASLVRIGDLSLAIEPLERSIALKPDFSAAYQSLGLLYYQADQFDQAIPPLERAVETAHKAPQTLFVLGLAYARAGKKEMTVGVITQLRELKQELHARRLEDLLRGLAANQRIPQYLREGEVGLEISLPPPPPPPLQSLGPRVSITGKAKITLTGEKKDTESR